MTTDKTTEGAARGTAVAFVAVLLAAAHHLDHVVRDHAGWPFTTDVNAFSWSLVLYPAFAFEMSMARRGRSGARTLRMALATVGLVVVTVIHLGPVAVDRLDKIASDHDTPLAGTLAVAITVGLILSLAVLVAVQIQARVSRSGAHAG